MQTEILLNSAIYDGHGQIISDENLAKFPQDNIVKLKVYNDVIESEGMQRESHYIESDHGCNASSVYQ